MNDKKISIFGVIKSKILITVFMGFFYILSFPNEASRAEKNEIKHFVKMTNHIVRTCESEDYEKEIRDLKKRIKEVKNLLTKITNKLSKGEKSDGEMKEITNELLRVVKNPYARVITSISTALGILVAYFFGLKKRDVRNVNKEIMKEYNKNLMERFVKSKAEMVILQNEILRNKKEYFEQLRKETQDLKHLVSTFKRLGIKRLDKEIVYSKDRIEKIKAKIISDYSDIADEVVQEARDIENQIKHFESLKRGSLAKFILTLKVIKEKKQLVQ